MYLKHISLTNFRNFARLDIDMPRGTIVLMGSNAQGKTSFLEAIYFLATFTSFHASNDRQLIHFLSAREPLAVSRVVAEYFRNGESHRLELRIIQENEGSNEAPRLRKETLLDGVKFKLGDVLGSFNAVLFLPQMLRILEGTPEDRRRYLNLTCGQVLPRYPAVLVDYARALSQRNALLKQLNERGGDPEQLAYWDELLALSGAGIIHARIRAIQELERLATPIHKELTRQYAVLRMMYQPSFDPLVAPSRQYTLPIEAQVNRSYLTVDHIQAVFQDNLTRQRREEIARGVTTMGPHRDEFRVLEDGVDLGIYGSRGQVRTAMLALKMAEVAWMREVTGQWPVLLLDEVLSELDRLRRQDLLSRLDMSEQVLMTTTDLDMFSQDFLQGATLWQVSEGKIKQR